MTPISINPFYTAVLKILRAFSAVSIYPVVCRSVPTVNPDQFTLANFNKNDV